jgi:hypothetical protein
MSEEFCVDQQGTITIHTFKSHSEVAIDTWAIALARLIEATPPDEMFRVLLDVSAKQVNFTRYARQKTVELVTQYKNRRGRLAFLFSSKTAPHFARIFFASLGKITFERAYFSSREQAMNWLR